MYMEFTDAKYGFSKMYHYDGFLHIESHLLVKIASVYQIVASVAIM